MGRMWADKQGRGGKISGRVHHSRWFHRYYEGYAEHRTIGEDGRLSIKRYYTGNYYRQDIPESKRILLKITYLTEYFGAAAFFFYAGTRGLESNIFRPVILLQSVAVLLLVCLFITLLCYLAAGRDMEIHTYRETSEGLIRYCRFLAPVIGGTGALSAVFCMIQGMPPGQTALQFLAYLVSAGCILGLLIAEKKLPYLEIPNTVRPEDEDIIIGPL